MRAFQESFQIMMSEQKDLFDQFQLVHDAYVLNPEANKARFNELGREVTDVIREYDRKLCAQMGKGQYSKFTQNLSEKFWGEVRKVFPKIDFVGVQ
jgi:DnaJ-domain-containing protein 1